MAGFATGLKSAPALLFLWSAGFAGARPQAWAYGACGGLPPVPQGRAGRQGQVFAGCAAGPASGAGDAGAGRARGRLGLRVLAGRLRAGLAGACACSGCWSCGLASAQPEVQAADHRARAGEALSWVLLRRPKVRPCSCPFETCCRPSYIVGRGMTRGLEPTLTTIDTPTVRPPLGAAAKAGRSFASLRSILALMLREMSTRYGRTPGGYIWAIVNRDGRAGGHRRWSSRSSCGPRRWGNSFVAVLTPRATWPTQWPPTSPDRVQGAMQFLRNRWSDRIRPCPAIDAILAKLILEFPDQRGGHHRRVLRRAAVHSRPRRA